MGKKFVARLKGYGNHIYETALYKFSDKNLSPIRFVITGRGRSGSSALVSMLNSLPNVKCDGEILAQPVINPFTHVLAKCRNSKSEVYGCKVLSYQILKTQPIDYPEGFIQELFKNDFKIIYLDRENLIHLALSNIRARQFGFHKNKSEHHSSKKITVQKDDLIKWIKISELHKMFEEISLDNIPHLRITYEKHLENHEKQQETVKLICDFLGIEYTKAINQFQKVSPKNLKDSVENYEEMIGFLENTPYYKYLGEDVKI